MSFVIFATWVLVGLLAGLLAGLVMKRGGYGLKRDIILGLVGSIGGSTLLRTVGVFTGAGIVAVAVVAFIGTGIPIVAQRKIWPTESAGEEKADEWWRLGLGADRKSTRLNSSHLVISYAVFCLKKKKKKQIQISTGERWRTPKSE